MAAGEEVAVAASPPLPSDSARMLDDDSDVDTAVPASHSKLPLPADTEAMTDVAADSTPPSDSAPKQSMETHSTAAAAAVVTNGDGDHYAAVPSSPSPLPTAADRLPPSAVSVSVSSLSSLLSLPIPEPPPTSYIIRRCALCHQFRKIETIASRSPSPPPSPSALAAWTCAQHPDPSLASCSLPTTSTPAPVIAFSTLRLMPPFNYQATLGLLPFTAAEYDICLSHPLWSLHETLWLLERVRDEGVAAFDSLNSDPVLSRRGREECEVRLLHVLAMAALYQRSVSVKSMPINPFIQHVVPIKAKLKAAGDMGRADGAAGGKEEADERPKSGRRLTLHERMQTAVNKKRSGLVSSTKRKKRDDADDDADFRGSRVTGSRSSGRLAGQKRKKYEDSDESDEEMDDDERGAGGAAGAAAAEPDYLWKIEKILAERQRVARVDDSGRLSMDDSSSDDEDDEQKADGDAAIRSPRRLRLHREHSLELALPPAAATDSSSSSLPSASSSSSSPSSVTVTQYLVKVEGQSYLHTEWHTRDSLLEKFGERNAADRLSRYTKQRKHMEAVNADRYGGEPFDPRFLLVDRVIASDVIEIEPEMEQQNAAPAPPVAAVVLKGQEVKAMDSKQGMEEGEQKAEPDAAGAAASSSSSAVVSDGGKEEKAMVASKSDGSGRRSVEMFLVKWQGLSYSQATWESGDDIEDELKIAQFRRFNRPPASALSVPSYTREEFTQRKDAWYAASPVYKGKNTLRSYQVDGLNWLIRCWYDNRNGILADEMGLGKTLQTITLFEHLRKVEHIAGPFLVIVPLGTLSHWKREVETWTDMNVVVYHDVLRGRETREIIRQHEFYYPGEGGSSGRVKFHILLTTYEVLMTDIEQLQAVDWRYEVIDEGHRLKNKSSKILEALRLLRCERRLLLTGTPIQNNTGELWTLLNFLEPSVFNSAVKFSEAFGHLAESQQVEALQERIRPFVLRRMKEAVERSIPGKEETIIDIELTMLQKKYYRAIYEKNLSFLRQGVSRSNMPRLVNMEIELRKCCLTGDHRVLTRAGWKSIKEVQRGDEVLTFNMTPAPAARASRRGNAHPATYSSSYQQEWKLVTDKTSHEVDAANEADQLYRMQGDTMDVIATRDHRMLLARMNCNTETGLSLQAPFDYSTVGELLPRESDDEGRRAVKYEVSDLSTPTHFALSPTRSVVRGGHNPQPAAPLPPIPGLKRVCEWWWRLDGQISFLQYLGMWLGDGHLDATHGLVIIAQKKEAASCWPVRLLDKLVTPACYRINRHHSGLHQYIINCPPLYDYLRLKAVGPPGYNPRDDGHLRNYPHFTKDEGLATEEEKSAYCRATGIDSRWSEEHWLLAFLAAKDAHGPECCWWCDESEWDDDNEMLRCHGPDCTRGGHMQCAGFTGDAPEGDWLCPVCLHFADIAKMALQLQLTMVMASGGKEGEDEGMKGDEEIEEEDEDRPLLVDRVDDEGDAVEIPSAEAVQGDGGGETVTQAGERLRAEGKVAWWYQPAPVVPVAVVAAPLMLPPSPPPVPIPAGVSIPAGAAVVPWNNGWWIIINGHWFSLKRWLGTQQQVASVWSRLSRRQALAVIEGFCRADGEWKRIRYLDDEDAAQPHEPTGTWLCSSSSFPLIDQLQLLAQLAGAATEMERVAVAVSGRETIIDGRTVRFTVDHWRLHITFHETTCLPIHCAPLARPENVSTSIDARGYHEYEDDDKVTKVYCITVEGNANFLTQRLSVQRLRSGRLGVRAAPVFVGNCQHPWLISGAEDKEIPPGCSDDEYMQKTVAASGKLVLLSKLLDKMQREGHKVLIFSQFVLVLDLLQEFCDWKRYQYERLDGGVRGNEREAAIDRFTKPDSNRFIFLLSTRAGGVGLNLATADTVIIFDSDWNPQQDMQAQARAHRIGQKRKVRIYRLVTRNTYESEMFLKASKKLGLDHAVLTNLELGRRRLGRDGGDAAGRGEGEDGEVDKESIDRILRLGAYGLFDEEEGEKKSKEFMEGDIEEILQKHSHVISFGKADNDDGAAEGANAAGSEERKQSSADSNGSAAAMDTEGGGGVVPAASSSSSSASGAAGQFRLNYSKLRFSSEKDASLIDVNDSQFWEKLMGHNAVSLVIPPDELLSQLTDASALESQASRDLFLSRLEKTVESVLDAKRRGEEVQELDGLVGLLIQFCATKEFKDERLRAEGWLMEAEKRVERKARLRQREELEETDRRRSGRRRGKLERRQRGEDSDFSDSEASPPEEEERTKGGRVRGRAGALMNNELCEICWTSGSLLGCDGQCERWYHLACLGMDEPPPEDERWLCDDCREGLHTCRICGKRDPDDWKGENGVRCCSVPRCGLSYHLACARASPLSVFYSDLPNSSFKCPSHYCARCAALGEVYYVHCLTCERALHVKCMGSRDIRLARKIIFCDQCADRERDTEKGKAAIAGSQVHTQTDPVRPKRKMKRPRKGQIGRGQAARRRREGKSGRRRLTQQQWEAMTEEERAEERERRAQRKAEQKQRANAKQKERRARKRQEREHATESDDDHTDSDSSDSSSDSDSDSSASSSSSSLSSSSSASTSSSPVSSSASSSSSDSETAPKRDFRPGRWTVRWLLDGELQAEVVKTPMFMAVGKRRRKPRAVDMEAAEEQKKRLERRQERTKRRQKKRKERKEKRRKKKVSRRKKRKAKEQKQAESEAKKPTEDSQLTPEAQAEAAAAAAAAGEATDSDADPDTRGRSRGSADRARAAPRRAPARRSESKAESGADESEQDDRAATKRETEQKDDKSASPQKVRVRVRRSTAVKAEQDTEDDEKEERKDDDDSAREAQRLEDEELAAAAQGSRRSARKVKKEGGVKEEEKTAAGRVRVQVRVNGEQLVAVITERSLRQLRDRQRKVRLQLKREEELLLQQSRDDMEERKEQQQQQQQEERKDELEQKEPVVREVEKTDERTEEKEPQAAEAEEKAGVSTSAEPQAEADIAESKKEEVAMMQADVVEEKKQEKDAPMQDEASAAAAAPATPAAAAGGDAVIAMETV